MKVDRPHIYGYYQVTLKTGERVTALWCEGNESYFRFWSKNFCHDVSIYGVTDIEFVRPLSKTA